MWFKLRHLLAYSLHGFAANVRPYWKALTTVQNNLIYHGHIWPTNAKYCHLKQVIIGQIIFIESSGWCHVFFGFYSFIPKCIVGIPGLFVITAQYGHTFQLHLLIKIEKKKKRCQSERKIVRDFMETLTVAILQQTNFSSIREQLPLIIVIYIFVPIQTNPGTIESNRQQ